MFVPNPLVAYYGPGPKLTKRSTYIFGGIDCSDFLVACKKDERGVLSNAREEQAPETARAPALCSQCMGPLIPLPGQITSQSQNVPSDRVVITHTRRGGRRSGQGKKHGGGNDKGKEKNKAREKNKAKAKGQGRGRGREGKGRTNGRKRRQEDSGSEEEDEEVNWGGGSEAEHDSKPTRRQQ
ncbi:hypothetical protein B0H14DRAFT_2637707 [Mycena olivaceomarginata]|nr:hypothetical protein B0H14DRAFT_2637707 [Mycena olivaceomarginata]